MFVRVYLLFALSKVVDTCLPTQFVQVLPTTTTTSTTTMTTTTTASPASPCTGCPKIYDTGCLGPGLPDWCATAADVALSYVLGIIPGFSFGDANTCSTTFSCPLGTSSQYELFGYTLPGPSLVVAYCQQDGVNAGKWYYGIPPLATPIQLKSLTCVSILGK